MFCLPESFCRESQCCDHQKVETLKVVHKAKLPLPKHRLLDLSIVFQVQVQAQRKSESHMKSVEVFAFHLQVLRKVRSR